MRLLHPHNKVPEWLYNNKLTYNLSDISRLLHTSIHIPSKISKHNSSRLYLKLLEYFSENDCRRRRELNSGSIEVIHFRRMAIVMHHTMLGTLDRKHICLYMYWFKPFKSCIIVDAVPLDTLFPIMFNANLQNGYYPPHYRMLSCHCGTVHAILYFISILRKISYDVLKQYQF